MSDAQILAAIPDAAAQVLAELERLGVTATHREHPLDADLWWAA